MAGRLFIALLLCAPAMAAGPVPVLPPRDVPLPEGAVARLGTLRWRFKFYDDFPQVGFSPDGKAVLCCNSDGFVAFRRSDGSRLPLPKAATTASRFHFAPGGKALLVVCPDRPDNWATSATVRRYTWPELKAGPSEELTFGGR